MKRFAILLFAAASLIGGIGVASAQMHGGSRGGGAHAGGQVHSGGSWHGGGNWQGGNWHGGNWHGHGSRVVIGVGFGAPWWGWWPAYYPAYYPYYSGYYYPSYSDSYPYDYTAPRYIEKDSSGYSEQGSSGAAYSYYCRDPAGYYPQVATCSSGWLRVVPESAPPGAPAQR